MITENLSTLKIHKLTQAQYDREREAGNLEENALYLTPDESGNFEKTTEVSTSWTGSAAPYSQSITVPGILEKDNPFFSIIPSIDPSESQVQEEEWCKIYKIVTDVNTVTFYAREKTTVSLPILIKVVR